MRACSIPRRRERGTNDHKPHNPHQHTRARTRQRLADDEAKVEGIINETEDAGRTVKKLKRGLEVRALVPLQTPRVGWTRRAMAH